MPGCFSRLITFNHLAQFGSTRMLHPWVWTKKEACPIQVIQNLPGSTLGNRGMTRWPERLVKSDGIRTSERKFRRCHAIPGRKPTRVDFFVFAPLSDVGRTTFVFFEKGIGTCEEAYKLARVKQNVLAPGAAFTRNGARLSRGGGFFDPFVSNRVPQAVKVDICFNRQIIEFRDLDGHDLNVDAVVTG
jgi:hypothetical protein